MRGASMGAVPDGPFGIAPLCTVAPHPFDLSVLSRGGGGSWIGRNWILQGSWESKSAERRRRGQWLYFHQRTHDASLRAHLQSVIARKSRFGHMGW
jgi:hypothetical protein